MSSHFGGQWAQQLWGQSRRATQPEPRRWGCGITTPAGGGETASPAKPSPPCTDGVIRGLDRVSTEDDATQGKETVLWGVFFLFLKQLAVYNSFK